MLENDVDEYPYWAELAGELHARPYYPITGERIILRCCFLAGSKNDSERDQIALLEWCRDNSVALPGNRVRHFMAKLEDYVLIWERHSEFVSLTWQFAVKDRSEKSMSQQVNSDIKALLVPPFNVVVRTRIDMRKAPDTDISRFGSESLCMSLAGTTDARIATDFRADAQGFTHFHIRHGTLAPLQAGMLVRQLLELDTYRNLALLGFLVSKDLAPNIAGIERQTMKLTAKLNKEMDLPQTRSTLDEITSLAGSLANISANNQYRLSASRAYYKLVLDRLRRLDEQVIDNHQTIEAFLILRLAPAMRTCESVENRIAKARSRLTDATRLMRTRIDIEMQAQNKSLLESMNRRADLQYRLQRTVEGLSIAAVSYYIVGLVSYMLKGWKGSGVLTYQNLIALAVPVTVFTVWIMIRRIKKTHE